MFGLLGPNGAGKTTTLRMIGGLIPPTPGEIRIGGAILDRITSSRLRRRIGFLTETPGLWEHLTVTDNLLTPESLRRTIVVEMFHHQPALAALPIEAAAEAFLFQQLLLILIIGPVVGACSLAAYSVVGEKQQRTLEPLLTTPLTTVEIVVAKAVASFLPALAVQIVSFAVFVGTLEVGI